MKVHGWRIIKTKYADQALTGHGAREFGGRWNSKGIAIVYMSGSISLAMLETLVHLRDPNALSAYSLIEVIFDEAFITIIEPEDLPKKWRTSPPPLEIQHLGDDWIASQTSAVLRVPSAIVPQEWNYLINPLHSDFGKIQQVSRQEIQFDPRLIWQ